MPEEKKDRLEAWIKLPQVISVVVGVVISALSFSASLSHDAAARQAEADARKFEAVKYNDHKKAEADKQAIEAAKPSYRYGNSDAQKPSKLQESWSIPVTTMLPKSEKHGRDLTNSTGAN